MPLVAEGPSHRRTWAFSMCGDTQTSTIEYMCHAAVGVSAPTPLARNTLQPQPLSSSKLKSTSIQRVVNPR